MRVRTLVVAVDPLMRGTSKFGKTERAALLGRLDPITERFFALHGFVADCVEHISHPRDLIAFYLHLIHVQRMVDLLAHAMGLTGAFAVQPKRSAKKKAPSKKKQNKRKTKKKSTAKKSKKKAAKKKTRKKAAKKTSRKKKTKKAPAKRKRKK